MSTYQELKGLKIKYLSADTSGDRIKEGEVFYNSTSCDVKTFVTASAWHSATSFSTSGYGAAGSGTLTAGLITGRNTLASGDTPSNATEEWNGNGWATGGDLSTARYYGGAIGTQTATVFVGGDSRPPGSGSQNTAENYNGTSWTSGTAYPEAVTLSSGFGTTSAGLMCNGSDTTYSATTKEYNGSWTAGGDLNTARRWIGTAGTQTAGLAFGGQIPPSGYSTNVTEEYDGSSWTNSGNLNTTRAVNAVGGGINQDASQTNALASGGYQSSGSPKSYFNETEIYNGSTWTSSANMGTARGYGTGGGTGSAGIVAGAYTGSITTAVEEFTTSLSATTAAAWSSGGNHPQNIRGGGSAGTQTAAWYVGGLQYPSDTKNRTDEYNGSSWTNVNNLPADYFNGNACGTLTAGLIFGSNAGYGAEEQVYEYDGTDWTAGGSLPDIGPAYGSAGGGGTQTAAVACGGYGDPPPGISTVLEYNGSSWSANPNSLPTGNYNQAGDGTATALWLAGGYLSSTATLHFDGTSFTTSGSMATARPSACGAGYGTQTNAIVAGGEASGTSTQGEQYNGTIWVTAPSMSQGRKYGLGASRSAGSQTGFICGGATPPNPNTNATEEFTPETVAVRSAKTFDFD